MISSEKNRQNYYPKHASVPKHAKAEEYALLEKSRVPAKVYVAAIAVLIVALASTFAWFYQGKTVDMDQVNGSLEYVQPYFESGTGTSSDPYVIKTAEQFYNFAWLQYIGTFNQSADGSTINQVYFRLDADIDLTDKTLPPVGTETYPFVGNFDGNGHTISSVTVSSSVPAAQVPELAVSVYGEGGDEIVGLFGVVGSMTTATDPDDTDKATGTIGSYTYSSSVNEIKDLTIAGATIEAGASKALVGIAAGYVNGTLSGVAIKDNGTTASTVKVTNASATATSYAGNYSDYTVVGYCTAAYKGVINSTEVNAMEPKTLAYKYIKQTKGTGGGADGTIPMDALYNRLFDMYANTTGTYTKEFQYVSSETHTYAADSTGDDDYKVSDQVWTTPSVSYVGSTYTYQSSLDSLDASIGRISVLKRTATNTPYIYLSGGSRNGTKTIKIVKYYYEDTDAYAITDGNGHYLCISSDYSGITNGGSLEDATQWVLDSGKIYTIVDDTNYYLINNAGSLSVSSTTSTTWTIDDSSVTSVYNSNTYALSYNDQWELVLDHSYTIAYKDTDGTLHYLNVDSSGSIVSSTSDPTEWSYSGGYFSTTVNGTTYYIRDNNGTLTTTTNTYNRTSWTVRDGAIFDSNSRYIQYANGSWTLSTASTYYITDGNGNYLCNSNGSITNTTDVSKATAWTFDNQGRIKNGNYYLRNNNGSLSLTTQSAGAPNQGTNWTTTTDSITCSTYDPWYGNVTYSIAYDSGWTLKNTTSSSTNYKISFNGEYLNMSGGSLTTGTDSSTATVWSYSSYGELSTVDESGNTYYLRLTTSQYTGAVSVSLTSDEYSASDWDIDTTSGTVSMTTWTQQGRQWQQKTYYLTLSDNTWTGQESAPSTSLVITEQKDASGGNGYRVSSSLSSLIISSTGEGEVETIKNGTVSILNSDITYETETVRFPSPSYVPLTVQDDESSTPDYRASDGNTGYIVSGNSSTSGDSNTGGNIRVSRYDTNNMDDTIRTKTYLTSGYSTVTTSNASTLGLKKFTSSYSEYSSSISSYLYGIHFMDAAISASNTIKETVSIMGTTYSDYELPENSIDFNLAQQGYINFYAGTYYSGNNAFFSLHQVFRDSDNNITEIKQIKYIYGYFNNGVLDTTEEYIYQYSDGSYSQSGQTLQEYSSGVTGYAKIFDMSWLTNPSSFEDDTCYYFEVPANAGEYCLGSVSGKDGAYLLYLDLSTNGQVIDRQENQEEYITSSNSYEYAKGVSLIGGDDTVDTAGKISITLSGNPGTATLSKTSSTAVTFTETGTGAEVTCLTGGMTVNGSTDVTPISTTTTTQKKITYIDYNISAKTTSTTTLTWTQVGDATPTVSSTFKVLDEDGNDITSTSTAPEISTTDDGATTTIFTSMTNIIDWTATTAQTGHTVINLSPSVLNYAYELSADGSLTNTFVYSYKANINWTKCTEDPAEITAELTTDGAGVTNKKFAITIASDEDTTVRVVSVPTDTAYITSTLNGEDMVAGTTIDVSASAA